MTYYKVPIEQIHEVTLENANGTFTFIPNGTIPNGADWTLADAAEGEPIAPANISTLIDRLATLNLHTVLGKSESPDYGLATPLATLTVSTVVTGTGTTSDTVAAETKTTTFVVGAKDDETNTYYFKSSDSEFYVRLAAFTGDEFVNKQRNDFMVQAESATDSTAENSPAAPTNGPVAGPSPEATIPDLNTTDVPTGTSELESDINPEATPNTEIVPTNVETDTVESEAEPTTQPTVEASNPTTDTTETGPVENEAIETPASTATATN